MIPSMVGTQKYVGSIIEYLDQGRFRPGLVSREQNRHIAVLDASGREKLISRDLVLVRYGDRRADASSLAEALSELETERSSLASELDLNLLWEVTHEQGRSFTAAELAELFFGTSSTAAASVMLEALLNDRLYFVRRHMEFTPREPEQVERLRIQAEKIRMRSDEFRDIQRAIRQVLQGDSALDSAVAAQLVAKFRPYIENPFTRSRDLTAILESAAPEVDPVEVAFEVLQRLGEAPKLPRFAVIAGLKREFSPEALVEAAAVSAATRPVVDGGFSITIDDEDTIEIDDALSCESMSDGSLRVRVHIALVADFVAKDGAMDREAAERGTTVYLPETTIRMLPDAVSCRAASLGEGEEHPVLTTDIRLSPDGTVLESSIYPSCVQMSARLSYEHADELIARPMSGDPASDALAVLHGAAISLREQRRRAGALLVQRRESKVRVDDGRIEIHMLDTATPSRTIVGELMVLSNFVAARFAADNRIPIIYRVQPRTGGDFTGQRPRLSLYPEYHAGIGLDCYAQLSSPIRRYADLVLQRQLLAALARPSASAYSTDELLKVLAGAETAESEMRELERRAKRYWTLRYLESLPDHELPALAMRDGASAELLDYGVRGTLNGAPSLANQAPVMVRLNRIDPLRGWLSMEYVATATQAELGAR